MNLSSPFHRHTRGVPTRKVQAIGCAGVQSRMPMILTDEQIADECRVVQPRLAPESLSAAIGSLASSDWTSCKRPYQGFRAIISLLVLGLILSGTQRGENAVAQSLEILNGDPVPRDVRDLYDRGLQYLVANQDDEGLSS